MVQILYHFIAKFEKKNRQMTLTKFKFDWTCTNTKVKVEFFKNVVQILYHPTGQHPLPTPKPDLYPEKVMLSVWLEVYGIAYLTLLWFNTITTAEFYCRQLERLKAASVSFLSKIKIVNYITF